MSVAGNRHPLNPKPLDQACKETFEEAGEAREEGHGACIRDTFVICDMSPIQVRTQLYQNPIIIMIEYHSQNIEHNDKNNNKNTRAKPPRPSRPQRSKRSRSASERPSADSVHAPW